MKMDKTLEMIDRAPLSQRVRKRIGVKEDGEENNVVYLIYINGEVKDHSLRINTYIYIII